ncbi:MAG: hypothetical protein JWM34_487 [Ilumatobacteraceae bacterium]|nr:hypothetical protein [Ilumatobacteraceae bacterium]
MEIPIELPLDADGFLRRECPACLQEFKWHHGKTDAAPDDFIYPDVHWCPLCGQSAALDQWWTEAQLEYAQQAALGPAMRAIADELDDTFRNNSFIKFEVTSDDDEEVPDPLVEPDDMMIVAPPCHEWEPVKVPEDRHAPYFCLICGESFAV